MKFHEPQIRFEEALSDEWSGDFEVREVSLDHKPLVQLGAAVFILATIIVGRVLYIGVAKAELYKQRSDTNLGKYELLPAPRGSIVDRNGMVIAENKPVFGAYLDVSTFLHKKDLQEETLRVAEEVLGIPRTDVWKLVEETDLDRSSEPAPLAAELAQNQLVALKEKKIPTIVIRDGFKRSYPKGSVFSSLVGYIGLPTPKDMEKDKELIRGDVIGKAGLEAQYEATLRGKAGSLVKISDAKGNELAKQERTLPQVGETLKLSIDGELQEYFYDRMSSKLRELGRVGGVAIAMNPQNGEVLSLINFPTYDNNLFATSGNNEERRKLLTDSSRPLFNRAVSGLYSPGSTIKPLHALAALVEGIISPTKTIFSPGYLDIPNPYNPDKPTRYLDWRYQGDVDMSAAIAQSSDVYFYAVIGGTAGQKGLGIAKMREWWQKFGFDKETGIDMPNENSGFLPSPEWKEENRGRPWLLGDTYNISIGQGDFQITPMELINHISALANGGRLYRPAVTLGKTELVADFSRYEKELKEVQKGMRETVTSGLGTAHLLDDLPYPTAGKTGSAQINNNTSENAFFVGYAPYENPQIAILILVEHSKEGSLNAVPIAKDVFSWYYEHRLKAN